MCLQYRVDGDSLFLCLDIKKIIDDGYLYLVPVNCIDVYFCDCRFSEEEVKLLLKLITSNPPYTPSGVRFVSLGLCMLLACPYLIG